MLAQKFKFMLLNKLNVALCLSDNFVEACQKCECRQKKFKNHKRCSNIRINRTFRVLSYRNSLAGYTS